MEISTVGQCALELILNSIDAKTTGVAVRFHNEEKRIQVVDSGEGILPDILSRIGETEKKNGTNSQLLTYSSYSRGKSLKSIVELSHVTIITSRCEGSTETYEKVFKAGEMPVLLQGNRPAKGTSITIYGFQGSGWEFAPDAIRFVIASVALIYTNVSFTLQNQVTRELVTGIRKPHEPYNILNSICEQSLSLKTTWHLNSIRVSGFKISGYVGFIKPNSVAVRHIFINRRPSMCLQIQNLILETMNSFRDELLISSSEEIYFLIYIECPFSDYVLSSYASRTFVIFQNWQKILDQIKICIVNTVAMDYDLKAETSRAQKMVLRSNEYYGDAEESHLKEDKNYKSVKYTSEESKNIFNKQLEEKVQKAKQVSIPQGNQKSAFGNNFYEQSEDKREKARCVSFFPSRHRKIFEKEGDDKLGKTNPRPIFKKNYKTFLSKKSEDKMAKSKPFLIGQINSKEEMFDSSNLLKLKSQRLLMERLRKRESFCAEDDFELIDKNFLQSLMSIKNRIFKKPIKNQQSLTETHQPDQEETHQENKKEVYILSQEESDLLNQMDTDQRTLEAINQPKIHENKVILIIEKTNFKSFQVNQNFKDVGQNQNFDHKKNPTDLAKVLENSPVADICSQLSEWSDWKYESCISKGVVNQLQPTETTKKSTNHRLYAFLPPVLNPMLRFGKTNIISGANIQNDSDNICSAAFNPEINHNNVVSRYQNLNVRPCVVVSHSNEFKLNRKSLYSIKILNQINLEFIAALANQDGKRLLLMIDQHAADERIRYEDLLQSYRIDGTKQYFSVELHMPILISELEPQKCELLLSNETLLRKFGIRLTSESVGSLKVSSIPRCFLKKRSFDSDFKMACSVRNLLLEIVESLDSTKSASILPKSIHNAIASEACRGAVKFGDPLTIDQCDLLIQALSETNAPNRCAHGRPSVIPLLDITNLKKKQTKPFQGKLNFASLKKRIKNK